MNSSSNINNGYNNVPVNNTAYPPVQPGIQPNLYQQNQYQAYPQQQYPQTNMQMPAVQNTSINPEIPASASGETIKMPEMNENSQSAEQVKSESVKSQESYLIQNINNNQVQKQLPVNPAPQDSLDIVGVKLYGYKFSTQLANMKNKFMNMSGKGNPAKAKTWLIMLLDRLLKIESMKKI